METLSALAVFALLTVPLHVSIGKLRLEPLLGSSFDRPRPLVQTRADYTIAASLYATIVTLVAFLNSGMSAHMIGIMAGLGTGASMAVWLSTLRGIGQSGARLCEVAFGSGLSPLALGVFASIALPLCFVAGLFSGGSFLAGAIFALAYGGGNGLLTIVRGTQPLVLFDLSSYGALTGRLTAPSFFVSAAAPMIYANIIESAGNAAALYLSMALAGLAFGCSAILWWRFRPKVRPAVPLT